MRQRPWNLPGLAQVRVFSSTDDPHQPPFPTGMTDYFTDAHIRAIFKAKREGLEALDDEEHALYDEFAEMTRRAVAKITPEQWRAMSEGFATYERMAPADQMRYVDWTREQLLAPLIQSSDE